MASEPTVQDLTGVTQNYGTLDARQEIRDLIKQPIPTEYAAILRQSYAQKHIPIYGAIVYEDGIADPPTIHIRRYCYSLCTLIRTLRGQLAFPIACAGGGPIAKTKNAMLQHKNK